MQRVDSGQIEQVTWNTKDNSLNVKQKDGTSYDEAYPDSDSAQAQLLNRLEQNNVKTEIKGKGGSSLLSLLTYILPFLLFFAFWIFLMNQMQGGGSRVMSFGKSRAKRMSVDAPKITFRDVAGADEAVQELHEIKEFLENPKKFQSLGARIPKGVLLYGPPGTGKTLLARAVAGEAGVPFFSISGSDFVEMFVGVGASRVRDLFEQAKQNSPCIIFMDEIDAVGRHRGAGMGGGHDEREQTLNQLLVEMDGFEMKDNIILIAATNRPDILDPALLRPGRFDRQVVVDRPDRKGRKHILEVHTRGKPLAQNIDLDTLAGQTPGFTGADLANLINEAALLTARSNKREITMLELEEGIMRVIAGPEKKSRVMSEKERLDHRLPRARPRDRRAPPAQLGPRSQGLDHQSRAGPRLHDLAADRGQVPHHPRRAQRHDGDDPRRPCRRGDRLQRDHHRRLQRPREGDRDREADGHALRHVRAPWARVSSATIARMPFLGREFSAEPDYSDEVAREIDDEVRRMVEDAHQTSKDILSEHREQLDTLSRILLERETIEADEFIALLEGKAEDEVFADEEEAKPPEAPARRGEGHGARGTPAACRGRGPVLLVAGPRCAPTIRRASQRVNAARKLEAPARAGWITELWRLWGPIDTQILHNRSGRYCRRCDSSRPDLSSLPVFWLRPSLLLAVADLTRTRPTRTRPSPPPGSSTPARRAPWI